MVITNVYFDEFVQSPAYKIGLANWVLYDGLQPVILDEDIPAEPFRLAFTLSEVTGHTTLEGSITVDGDEEIEFNQAGRRTNTYHLDALPVLTIAGLDCNILVECVSEGGAPLKKETLTEIEIVCFPKTRIVKDPAGSGSQETNYDVYTEAVLAIGDQIRYTDPHQGQTIDIYVVDVSSAIDLEDNTQPFRVYHCS